MRTALGLLVAATLAGATGCVNRTMVVSHEKQAYVVHQTLFSATVYHCDASGQRPVCHAVEERE